METINEALLNKFSSLIYDSFGIFLNQSKREMVQSKIERLVKKNNLESCEAYYLLVSKATNPYWQEFVDEITVHQTGFFRENNHFEYIRSQLRTILENNIRITKTNELRVWSAGCSTGEEPYTLAMVLKEWLPSEIAIKILATDVSERTLAFAQKGAYSATIKKDMDQFYLLSYFNHSEEGYEVKPELKELITFRSFNLMEPFPLQNNFDMIFCRNVMIYFDIKTQQELITKFYDVLTLGGILFIGHSESLVNKQHNFRYLEPTTYLKEKQK
jgi:chemotaxis protein methyltransferase CheR